MTDTYIFQTFLLQYRKQKSCHVVVVGRHLGYSGWALDQTVREELAKRTTTVDLLQQLVCEEEMLI